MSDLQRRNVIDAGVTLATWATTSAIVAVMFGDSDDEDSMKKWSSEMNMRIVDQWNGIDWLNASTSQPAAVKSILEVFKGMWEVSVATSFMAVGGDDEDIYTKRGDLRGSNKILKNIPLSSSYYDAEKFIENSDYWSE